MSRMRSLRSQLEPRVASAAVQTPVTEPELRMKFFVRVLPYAALVVLAGCETVQTTDAGAVGVTREQRVTTMVSSQEIEQQAAKEYAQLMSEAQKRGC